MSFLSENIVPGDQGKVFGTNAKSRDDLQRIKNHLLTLEGVKDVEINSDTFPAEITIYTMQVVKVDDLQKRVMEVGFHVMPKGALSI